MDPGAVRDSVARQWGDDVLTGLSALVRIPAVSAAYDPAWETGGHLDAAVASMREWIEARKLGGARCSVERLPGRGPVLLVEVPATAGAPAAGTVLLYGHLDKQPAQNDWSEGLDPWRPVLRDGRLYGRGTVDDGYAGFAAVAALTAIQDAGGDHARTVILLETGEESGSPDLAAYVEHLAARLGDIALVVCLDGGGGDRERLWLTTSLRGVVQATVTVTVLDAGVHSGLAGGIVPSSFRILRQLLDRLEDSATGEILVPELTPPIPPRRRDEAATLAARQPAQQPFPLVEGLRTISDDPVELILNNTWRPTLSVTGAAGLPDPAVAGAVIRPSTTLRLSLRLPPTVDAAVARDAVVRVLTTDIPYGARVEIDEPMLINGWQAPDTAPWLSGALTRVGDQVFGKPCVAIGVGGGIPFMELLGRSYPLAQFVVTGALGQDNNMHGPDEWLDLGFAARVTEAVAHLIDAHATTA
jgi:acetylornithine deacetylase/succinyl-diaminopimelate desuccinylase-like protein